MADICACFVLSSWLECADIDRKTGREGPYRIVYEGFQETFAHLEFIVLAKGIDDGEVIDLIPVVRKNPTEVVSEDRSVNGIGAVLLYRN